MRLRMNGYIFLYLSTLICVVPFWAAGQTLSNQRGSTSNERLQMSPGSRLNERLQQAPGFVPGTMNPAQPAGNRQQTVAIIKPDTVQSNRVGDVIARLERTGLHLIGIKMVRLDRSQASQFYSIYRDRPFYPQLIEFISSGPIVVLALQGENAIARVQQLMQGVNSAWAGRGIVRSDFAPSMSRVAIEGPNTAQDMQSIFQFFFLPNEIFSD